MQKLNYGLAGRLDLSKFEGGQEQNSECSIPVALRGKSSSYTFSKGNMADNSKIQYVHPSVIQPARTAFIAVHFSLPFEYVLLTSLGVQGVAQQA